MAKLYDYWRSSASYRVRIALGLADEAWERVEVNLVAGEQAGPDHLEINPQGLVPALEIDGKRLTQSLAIIEYLNETRNLGLLPKVASEQAHVRALSYAIAMEIHPVCNLRVAKYAVEHSNDGITMQGWMQTFIGSGLEQFEAMLGSSAGDYCFGDQISMADICLVPQIYNAKRWQVDLSNTPKSVAIAERLGTLEAFANAYPDNFAPSV